MSLVQLAGGVGMIGAGVFLGHWGMRTYRASKRSQVYEPVKATIRNSRLRSRESGGNTTRTVYRPDIEYEYTVGGETFVNTNLYPGPGQTSTSNKDKHQEIVDKYPEGAVVEAYYDPKDPSISVLINKSRKLYAIGLIAAGGLFVVVGFGIAVWVA